jgi:hypothetical protein
MFENELLPPAVVQQEKHVVAVKCCTLFSGLISEFVFDILKIPSGCIAPLAPSPIPFLQAGKKPQHPSDRRLVATKAFWLKNTNSRSCRYHTNSNYSCQTVSLNTKFESSHSNGYNTCCILYCHTVQSGRNLPSFVRNVHKIIPQTRVSCSAMKHILGVWQDYEASNILHKIPK